MTIYKINHSLNTTVLKTLFKNWFHHKTELSFQANVSRLKA